MRGKECGLAGTQDPMARLSMAVQSQLLYDGGPRGCFPFDSKLLGLNRGFKSGYSETVHPT